MSNDATAADHANHATITLHFTREGADLLIHSDHSIHADADPVLRFAVEVAAQCLGPLTETVQEAITGQYDPNAPVITGRN